METIADITHVRSAVHARPSIVRHAIMLCELGYAPRGHTRVWNLGERVAPLARPLHVRWGLELRGGVRLNVRMHFGMLVEWFSEGVENEDGG